MGFTDKEISDKVKELKKQYATQWRVKNKDKIKASIDRYWNKKAVEELSKIEYK